MLFDENVSFDHYFGTYPKAANTDGTPFHAKPGTPKVNGLTPALLTHNPNEYNPQRLTHSEALTCDQNHSYAPEQKAVDNGAMDKFVQNTEHDTCTGQPIVFGAPGLVMDYYDGNTVTALWNYAQNYAMSDNNYDTDFGPSTPGALNLISGDDGGGYAVSPTTGHARPPTPAASARWTPAASAPSIGDIDPAFDDCSDTSHTSTSPLGVMTGKNIGDLLNARHVTWGWFQGGFAPTTAPTRQRRSRSAAPRTRTSAATRSPDYVAAPRPVPVLRVHGQPHAPAAVLGGRRSARPTRPTTSTTCRSSTRRCRTATCRPSAS